MLTKINKDILKIYLKHNPSLPRSIKSKISVIEDLVNFKLNLPINDLKKKKIIDLACGTGEFACYFASQGHNVYGYDFNPNSINLAKSLSKKLKISKNCIFQISEFFKVKNKGDIIICTAALHHLDDPYKGLLHLSSLVKENGYLILSFGNDGSNLQHNLMKILSRLNGDEHKKIYDLANYLFEEHITRCVKYGLRNKKAVIYDQFINPQHKYLNFNKIFKILKNYKLYSSWPNLYLPRGDSPYNDSMSSLKNKNFSLSTFYWSSKKKDDAENFSKIFYKLEENFSFIFKEINNKKRINDNVNNKISKKLDFLINNSNHISHNYNSNYKRYFIEIKNLLNLIKLKKNNIKTLKKTIEKQKILFKGTSGLGLNFLVLKKND